MPKQVVIRIDYEKAYNAFCLDHGGIVPKNPRDLAQWLKCLVLDDLDSIVDYECATKPSLDQSIQDVAKKYVAGK